MVMKKKKRKNILDERQEQQLLRIEHNGFWIAFWGLAIAFMIQLFLYGIEGRKLAAGEFIVFVCISLYMLISCIRYGIWDRWLVPSIKVNLFCSGIAGLFCGIYYLLVSYRNYHALWGAVATGVFMLFFVAIICFIILTVVTFLYRRRVDVLENEEERSESEEDE